MAGVAAFRPIKHSDVVALASGEYKGLKDIAADPTRVAAGAPEVRHEFTNAMFTIIGDSRGLFTSGVRQESSYAMRILSPFLNGSLARLEYAKDLRAMVRATGAEGIKKLKLERHIASAKEDVAPAAVEFIRGVLFVLKVSTRDIMTDEGGLIRLAEHLGVRVVERARSPDAATGRGRDLSPVDQRPRAATTGPRNRSTPAVARPDQPRIRLPTKPSCTLEAFNPLFEERTPGSPISFEPLLAPRAVVFFAKHYGLGCVPNLPLISQCSQIEDTIHRVGEDDDDMKQHETNEDPSPDLPDTPSFVPPEVPTAATAEAPSPSEEDVLAQGPETLIQEIAPLLQSYSTEGRIVCWGSDKCGELGLGPSVDPSWPREVPMKQFRVRRLEAREGEDGRRRAALVLSPGIVIPTQCASGSQFTVWLMNSGQVFVSGLGDWGQLGVGDWAHETVAPLLDKQDRDEPRRPPTSSFPIPVRSLRTTDTIVKVEAGFAYAVALASKGEMYLWGNNNHAQCNVGSATLDAEHARVKTPHKVALKGCPVIDVACGSFFVVALTEKRTILTWGMLSMLGLGTEEDVVKIMPPERTCSSVSKEERKVTSVPCRVPALEGRQICSIAAGQWHAIAVSDSGAVYSWGIGHQGRLGHGITSQEFKPKRIDALTPHKIVAAACGSFHTAVCSADGTVLCFGDNAAGQCGVVGQPYYSKAVRVSLPTKCCSVSCGREHTVALSVDGDIFAFGSGTQVGVLFGLRNRFVAPRQILPHLLTLSLTAGVAHNVALTVPRKLMLETIGPVYPGHDGAARQMDLPESEVLCSAAIGSNFTVALSRTGQVYTMGVGDWGQLGLGEIQREQEEPASPSGRVAPIVSKEFKRVQFSSESRKIAHVAAGFAFAFAISVDHTVYFWGNNNHSQGALGILAKGKTRIDSPVEVVLLSEKQVVQIACGSFFGLALTMSGSLYSWGMLDLCGFGPAKELTADPSPLLAAAVAQTNEDQAQVAAVPPIEDLLSTSSTAERRAVLSVPIRIPTLQGVTAIAAGQWHAVCLTERGNIYTWGIGSQGRLGLGDSNNQYVPVRITGSSEIPLPSQGFSHIACGSFNSIALSPSGTLFAWGDNASGQCGVKGGEGAEPPASLDTPTPILDGVLSASVGRQHIAVTTKQGEALIAGTIAVTGSAPSAKDIRYSGFEPARLTSRNKLFATQLFCGVHTVLVVNEQNRPSAEEVAQARAGLVQLRKEGNA